MANDGLQQSIVIPHRIMENGVVSIPSGSGQSREPVAARREVLHVLDKGFVELQGHHGGDLSVVNAARVSFAVQHEEMEEGDEKLISYLLRNKHGTPFEQNYFKFRVKAPIFVFREWHRHRIGFSYNEVSMRYTTITPEFYIPERVRTRVGKPGSYQHEALDTPEAGKFLRRLRYSAEDAARYYNDAIKAGVAPEMARMVLPVNTYSEMIMSCNARSLMSFLSLRTAENAQWEIQRYGNALMHLFASRMPITHKAWDDNGRIAP